DNRQSVAVGQIQTANRITTGGKVNNPADFLRLVNRLLNCRRVVSRFIPLCAEIMHIEYAIGGKVVPVFFLAGPRGRTGQVPEPYVQFAAVHLRAKPYFGKRQTILLIKTIFIPIDQQIKPDDRSYCVWIRGVCLDGELPAFVESNFPNGGRGKRSA